MHAKRSDIGSFIDLQNAITPQTVSGSGAFEVNGPAIEVGTANSCKVLGQTGAAGSQASTSCTFKLQHSADGSTGWTDVPDNVSQDAETAEITAANTNANFKAELGGCKAFIRLQASGDLTGGSAQSLLVCASIALGGQTDLPQ